MVRIARVGVPGLPQHCVPVTSSGDSLLNCLLTAPLQTSRFGDGVAAVGRKRRFVEGRSTFRFLRPCGRSHGGIADPRRLFNGCSIQVLRRSIRAPRGRRRFRRRRLGVYR